MLARLSIIAAAVAVGAVLVPDLATRYLERGAAQSAERATPATPVSMARYASGKGETLQASQGHYFGNFEINGRNQTGLIDTGASVVAINVSTARKLGLSPSGLNFNAPVSTANGVVKAARATLNRVELGSIRVDNVEAMVLPDASLSGMLIGMSFLNRLSSYRVENGALHLVN